MSYGHGTCPMVIGHVLWSWDMSYGHRTCPMECHRRTNTGGLGDRGGRIRPHVRSHLAQEGSLQIPSSERLTEVRGRRVDALLSRAHATPVREKVRSPVKGGISGVGESQDESHRQVLRFRELSGDPSLHAVSRLWSLGSLYTIPIQWSCGVGDGCQETRSLPLSRLVSLNKKK